MRRARANTRIGPNDLLGLTFQLTTAIDSYPRLQTRHKATVIGVNSVPPDSLLVQLDPPLPAGRYLENKRVAEQPWREDVIRFDKLVLIRRYAGTSLCPPCPEFPIVVHMYCWPNDPIVRTDPIVWNKPDDWAELSLESQPGRVKNSYCSEVTPEELYSKDIPTDEDYRQAMERFSEIQANIPRGRNWKQIALGILLLLFSLLQGCYLYETLVKPLNE